MVGKPTEWEMRTNLSKRLGSSIVVICRLEDIGLEVCSNAPYLEQVAGDFVARHVLEKDSLFFGG